MKKVYQYIGIILFSLLSIYLLLVVNNLNILPNKYLIIFICFIISLNIIASIFILLKNKILHILGYIIYFFILIISILGIKYGQETLMFLDNAFNNRLLEITNYNVIVLKNSDYHKLSDLDNQTILYLNNDTNTMSWRDNIINQINANFKGYDDLYELYDSIINKEFDAAIIEEGYLELLEENNINLNNKIRVIYTYSIKKKIKETEENVSLKPINIYLSGSDSRSDTIYNKSRSDVNIVITINPNTKTILTTSIPRDYYVDVYNHPGLKDKLTHTGIFGVDCTRQTIANLFDIDITYSVKVGFASLVNIVDILGGIDIDSDRTFNSYHISGWTVQKGINHMNGKQALAYARERYAYPEGDRHRVRNQQQVLEAILEKGLKDTNILFDYQNILNSLSSLYITDIPKEYIQLLVKNQLEEMSDWKIINQTVSGSDLHEVTYSTPNTKLYVMVPYEEDVIRAKNKIMEVMGD